MFLNTKKKAREKDSKLEERKKVVGSGNHQGT